MTLSDKFVQFIYNFTWFSKMWYLITMFFSKTAERCPIPIYSSTQEIREAIKDGTLYTSDNIANVIRDYLIHPSTLQCRLNKGSKFGDCDDHAIYWCVSLKKSKMVKKVWFSFYTMREFDGIDESYSSHAVCVYLDNKDRMFWCDYKNPNEIEEMSQFQKQSANRYGKEPICGVTWEVIDVKEDDTPVFGKITKVLPPMAKEQNA